MIPWGSAHFPSHFTRFSAWGPRTPLSPDPCLTACPLPTALPPATRGQASFNQRLQNAGLKAFSADTLSALRAAAPEPPPLSPRLVDMLLAAMPSWDDSQLRIAGDKLARVGATNVAALAEMLSAQGEQGLNEQLQIAGLKKFKRETLYALRETMIMREEHQASLLSPRLREFLRVSCPSWTGSEFEAAEEKLAAVGATHTLIRWSLCFH